MGNGYTRQSAAEIVDDALIEAADHNNEFNAIQSAFNGTLGHAHDGTVGNGPRINLNTSITGLLPVANGGIGGKNNVTATTDPTNFDDSSGGYVAGSIWVNTSTNVVYICSDATALNAVWTRYQPYNANLVSIAGLSAIADRLMYSTAPNTWALTTVTAFARTLLDDADAAAARATLALGSTAEAVATLGLGNSSILNVGTTANTVAAGNDSRIVNATPNTRQILAGTGLSGGGDFTADRTLAVSYGTSAGTAAQGNDSRIVNAVPNSRQITPGTGLSGGGDLTANRSFAVLYGTTAGTATEGNDTRLVNAVPNTRTVTGTGGLTGGGALNVNQTISLSSTTNASLAKADTAVQPDNTLLNNAVQKNVDTNLTAGYTSTAVDDGTKSSGTYTPTPVNSNLRYISNNGAFTLAAPTAAGDYTLVIKITNGASAGAISMTGFNKVVGDVFTTVNLSKFLIFITKINGTIHAVVQALQ